jgi:hypothetical protein
MACELCLHSSTVKTGWCVDQRHIIETYNFNRLMLLLSLLPAAGLASSDAASTASALLVSASSDGSMQRTLEKQG